MLIESFRHKKEDLLLWKELEEMDKIIYLDNKNKMEERESNAIDEIRQFANKGKFYVGVSWGKDSVIVAHLAQRARLFADKSKVVIHRRKKYHVMPLVWIKVNPIYNPDCISVEKVFLSKYLPTYERVEVECKIDENGAHAKNTLEQGAKEAAIKYSKRYISGINRNESGMRNLSRIVHGVSTENCCRPIIDWPEEIIFAYLVHYDLPIHPAYAMFGNGRWRE